MVAAQAVKSTPWWSIGLVVGVATAFGLPEVADQLIFERAAIARGEIWRLLSAHIVHYSGAHLFNNVLVLLPVAWLVERRYRNELGAVLIASALAIGAAVLVFAPEIQRYAGASGLSFALLSYAAVRGLFEGGRWRIVCAVMLALLIAKLFFESMPGWQIADWARHGGFVALPLSHAVGTGTGVAIALMRAPLRPFAQLTGQRESRNDFSTNC